MAAPAALRVQIFGLADSRPTQASLRFFKERRVDVTFVDLRKRPIAPGELRRFAERLGAAALLDTDAASTRTWDSLHAVGRRRDRGSIALQQPAASVCLWSDSASL